VIYKACAFLVETVPTPNYIKRHINKEVDKYKRFFNVGLL